MNILIPNIGRRGYLVRYLRSTPDFTGNIYVSDCDNTASGLYSDNDGAFILPRPADNERHYVNSLLDICARLHIDVIIPVIDPEIFILSKYRELFIHNNIFITVSSNDVLNICYNKLEMNRFLSDHGYSHPKTYDSITDFNNDLDVGKISFPVIIKPIWGSGSESTYKVNSQNEVNALFHNDMVIQEYIDGQEYGIDLFNDQYGNPVRCVIKRKISMRSGETDKSVTVIDPSIRDELIRVGTDLGHICNLDCDIITKDNKIYFLDFNPRFGGGYPATHEAEVNLLDIVVRIAGGQKVNPVFDNYRTGIYTFKEINIVSTEVLI